MNEAGRPGDMQIEPVQEWEGHVVAMEAEAFVAHLVDLRAGGTYAEEEAIIPYAEVSAVDAARMRIGAIFRWTIGYEWSPDGTRNRVSRIVFPDVPRMTKADLDEGKAWARKVVQSFHSRKV